MLAARGRSLVRRAGHILLLRQPQLHQSREPLRGVRSKKGRASLFTSLGSCFLSTGLTMCGVFGAWVSATKKRELNKAVQLVEAKPNARAGAEANQKA